MNTRHLAVALVLGTTALVGCQQKDQNAANQPAPAPVAAAPAPVAAPAPAESSRPERRRRDEDRRDRMEQAPAPVAVCGDCGTVTNIEAVRETGSGSGIGAVAGAAAGGVIGHQMGNGRGKDVATVAGALLGAFGGNEAEKQVRATTVYKVTVAMNNGSTQTATVASPNGIAVGSKVHVVGNNIQPE